MHIEINTPNRNAVESSIVNFQVGLDVIYTCVHNIYSQHPYRNELVLLEIHDESVFKFISPYFIILASIVKMSTSVV